MRQESRSSAARTNDDVIFENRLTQRTGCRTSSGPERSSSTSASTSVPSATWRSRAVRPDCTDSSRSPRIRLRARNLRAFGERVHLDNRPLRSARPASPQHFWASSRRGPTPAAGRSSAETRWAAGRRRALRRGRDAIVDRGRRRIDLVKIDCEGANCRSSSPRSCSPRIDRIVGELPRAPAPRHSPPRAGSGCRPVHHRGGSSKGWSATFTTASGSSPRRCLQEILEVLDSEDCRATER